MILPITCGNFSVCTDNPLGIVPRGYQFARPLVQSRPFRLGLLRNHRARTAPEGSRRTMTHMTDHSSLPRITTAHGTVFVAQRDDIDQCLPWKQAFANSRKDRRYYEIVEDTIRQGFDYGYFVMEDTAGVVRSVQPFFLLDQDLLQGSGARTQRWTARLRKLFPKALTIRTLMVGCAAGEGHLDHTSDEHAD